MTIRNEKDNVSLENVQSTVRQLLENGGKEVVLRKPGERVRLVLRVEKNKKNVVVVYMSVVAKLNGEWYTTYTHSASITVGNEGEIISFAKHAVAKYEAALNKRMGVIETIKKYPNISAATATTVAGVLAMVGANGIKKKGKRLIFGEKEPFSPKRHLCDGDVVTEW